MLLNYLSKQNKSNSALLDSFIFVKTGLTITVVLYHSMLLGGFIRELSDKIYL